MLAAGAGAAFGQSTTSTPIVFSRIVNLPPVGVGSTETLQITVLNAYQGLTILPPVTALPSLPGLPVLPLLPLPTTTPTITCSGTITLFDTAGTQIGSATSFTAAAGQMASAKFSFGQLASSGPRVEVRGTVVSQCSLAYSMETFDTSSGATHLFFSGSATPALPSTLLGLLGQVPTN
jgi:hypothetical protein